MNNQEVEIRISDLFAALLKAIKPIVCLALIFALLGGLYGLRRAKGLERTETGEIAEVEKAEKAVALAETQLAAAERALVRYDEVELPDAEKKIEQAQAIVEQRKAYLEDSLYQQLDPFNCGVSTLTFYVDAEQTADPEAPWIVVDPRASIAAACTQISSLDEEILENVRRIMGTDAELRFIKELISVSNVSDQFVKILVRCGDAQVAEQVVDYLYDALLERLGDGMGEFSPRVISRFTGYDVDWSINDRQLSNEDKLLTAERALTDAEANRQELINGREKKEGQVDDAEKALKSAKKELRSVRLKTGYPALIYALIALAAGLVFGCVLAGFRWAVTNTLQNQRTILTRYPFPVLGVLPSGKKRLFARTIRRLEGDPETGKEAAACVAAQNILDLSEGKKTCLVSTLGSAAAEALTPYLNGKLAVCGDVLRDGAAVKALADFDSVVLVETRGKSSLDQIDSETQLLKTLGKEILGVVLL